MIDLSASVIKYLERDIVSAFLVILTLIMTVVLSYISGFVMLFRKKLKSYKVVKILSLINIFMSFVGLLSINAIGIGALQVDKFYKENFGIGFLSLLL